MYFHLYYLFDPVFKLIMCYFNWAQWFSFSGKKNEQTKTEMVKTTPSFRSQEMCTCSRTYGRFPSIAPSSILIVFSGLEYDLN